ncbi:MAG: hypothetical protein OEV70_13635, partial [Nitrospirota bacterium]|nr:hypothetical protein [Nitrospirota bacterium]
MSYRPGLIAVLLGITLGWSPLPTQAETTISSVTLDRAIHFTAPDGNDVVAEAGTYTVQAAGDSHLRLLPQTDQPAIEIQAQTTTHAETLSALTALLIAEEGQEDDIHLVLILPVGQAFDATGTFSGTRSRAAGFRQLSRTQVQSAITQRQPFTQAAAPPPILKVPPASAPVTAPPSPKMPTPPIVGGSKPIPHVTLIQGISKPEGPLTWSYLRMHEPDTILAMIKAVQAGIRHPKTLTGLASLRNLDTLLKTKYPDGFTAKNLPKVSAPIEGQVSTRGVVPSIRDHVQTQVQSSAIPPISSSTPGAGLTLPKKQGNGWNELFTMGGGGVLDAPKATQPKPQ